MQNTIALADAFTEDGLHREILLGLLNHRKSLPSKFLYDEEGSKLFESICSVPEYYVTRAETALLADIATELSTFIPGNATLFEFGSGASVKTRLLLDACSQLRLYVPMDISETAMRGAARSIANRYGSLKVIPVVGDFTQPYSLPSEALGYPVVGFFPGSTIGNFAPDEARDFLRRARLALGSAARMIVGADLPKSTDILLPAYNDSKGVTAEFNKNLLTRMNREYDADFDLDTFVHRSVWNSEESRIEMHLMSLYPQVVSVGNWTLEFQAGETIHTENSYKYAPDRIALLARESGWRVTKSWISESPEFGVYLLSA